MTKRKSAAQNSRNAEIAPLALRPPEAAKALGIGVRKLWEITADRTSGIPHVRLGKAVVYPIRELADWLTSKVPKHRTAGERPHTHTTMISPGSQPTT